MECIDISDKQFPATYPSNTHFSVHSITDLPAEWTGTFSYAHNRLLTAAMNDSRWRKAIGEVFRVLAPGGWVELVEHDAKDSDFGVGPYSKKLQDLIMAMYAERGVIIDLGAYLPRLLAEAGFVDVRREARKVTIGRSGETGYRSEDWRDIWEGTKQQVLNGDGYGFVKTEEEYNELLQGSLQEWNSSNEARCAFCTILARKP
ncbi:hypothetical protein GYMLUDRAFT_46152 [Collybiopsis luxurians FD-317 M1]|uniref:Unplaced genomic scaffold GYMLUscaffold_42, whole genome shotgun sequence n=1 Tax=Collybiopsis luxurians FD-317 M1 TaxID=944289 RepID=A0A0D0B316_9AGAR|nr:hypothetical protein GYMLUDRAFT_46152 [Collybiopsis luxurians FD-317 M1]